MNLEALHGKVIEIGKKNKKTLVGLAQHLMQRRKDMREEQNMQISDYRKEYEELVKLNQESEQENLRLRKEITLIDLEIDELSVKNTMSRSRIKLQSEEIDNIKDETYDIDKQKRKEERKEKENNELRKQIDNVNSEIEQLEVQFEERGKVISDLQVQYQRLIEKKESLSNTRKESHKRHKLKVEELQRQLRQLKNQSALHRIRKQKQQQKTKRNNKVETINQIWGMLRKHKQTYE